MDHFKKFLCCFAANHPAKGCGNASSAVSRRGSPNKLCGHAEDASSFTALGETASGQLQTQLLTVLNRLACVERLAHGSMSKRIFKASYVPASHHLMGDCPTAVPVAVSIAIATGPVNACEAQDVSACTSWHENLVQRYDFAEGPVAELLALASAMGGPSGGVPSSCLDQRHDSACRVRAKQTLVEAAEAMVGFCGDCRAALRVRITITEWCEGGTLHAQLVKQQLLTQRGRRPTPIGYLPLPGSSSHPYMPCPAPGPDTGVASCSDLSGTNALTLWTNYPPPPPTRVSSSKFIDTATATVYDALLHGYGKPSWLFDRHVAQLAAVQAALDIARGLAALHAAGVIHGSLGPCKVLFAQGPYVNGQGGLVATASVDAAVAAAATAVALTPQKSDCRAAVGGSSGDGEVAEADRARVGACKDERSDPLSLLDPIFRPSEQTQGPDLLTPQLRASAPGPQSCIATAGAYAQLNSGLVRGQTVHSPLNQGPQTPQQANVRPVVPAVCCGSGDSGGPGASAPINANSAQSSGHLSSALNAEVATPPERWYGSAGGGSNGGKHPTSTFRGSRSSTERPADPRDARTASAISSLTRRPPWWQALHGPARALWPFCSSSAEQRELQVAAGCSDAPHSTTATATVVSFSPVRVTAGANGIRVSASGPAGAVAGRATGNSFSCSGPCASPFAVPTPTSTLAATTIMGVANVETDSMPTALGTDLAFAGTGSASVVFIQGLSECRTVMENARPPKTAASMFLTVDPAAEPTSPTHATTATTMAPGDVSISADPSRAAVRTLSAIPAVLPPQPLAPDQAGGSPAVRRVASGPISPTVKLPRPLAPTHGRPVTALVGGASGLVSGGAGSFNLAVLKVMMPSNAAGTVGCRGRNHGALAASAAAAAAPTVSCATAMATARTMDLSFNTTKWRTLAYAAPELFVGLAGSASDGGKAAASTEVGEAATATAAAATTAIPAIGPEADVYSFGALLWQLCSGGRPPHYERHPAQILMGLLTGDLDLEWPDEVDPEVAALGRACMRRKPDERPTAAQVRDALEEALHRLQAVAATAAKKPFRLVPR